MKPIKDFRIFDGFSSLPPSEKEKDIDDFIHNDAERHFSDKIAVTYGLFYDAPKWANSPLGFATLQNDAIEISLERYNYPNLPAVKIGRFGIRQDAQRRGFGTHFLNMIKRFMSQPDNRTGCRFLTLSTFPPLFHFYEKNNFTVLNGKAPRPKSFKQFIMYLDLVRTGFHR